MISRLMNGACDDEQLRRLLGGDLSESDAQRMECHLEECAFCRARLESFAAEEKWWSGLPEYLNPETWNGVTDGELNFESSEQLINKYLKPAQTAESLGRFGEYDIEEVIGAGAMGVVLKAHDASLNRRVAIKVLSPRYADSESARRRFERESRSVAAVVDPHVVPIHAVNATYELPYLVMAYVSGESLQQRIARCGPLDAKDILRIGMQTAKGLAAAHSQGIVHRDIKPANILLEDGLERVVLSDFGLARAVDDITMTRPGMLAGTPEYMSPEQAMGVPVDHRSDLFSLGCVMFAMSTGQSPFRANSTMAVLKRICEHKPADIRDVNDQFPSWLQVVINRLLEKVPSNRYQSASAVASLLEQCLAHEQQPSVIPMPREIAQHAERERKGKWNVSNRQGYWWWTIAGAILVICLAVSTRKLLHRKSHDVSTNPISTNWSVPTMTFNGHTACVYTVAFSPDGATLASADDLGVIKLWNLETGETVATFNGHARGVLSLDFDATGAWLASASADGDIILWDVVSRQKMHTLKGHERRVRDVCFSADSETLASCGDDQTVRLWDVATGREKSTLEGHNGAVRAISFSPDGDTLASGGVDMRIQLWDTKTGEQISVMKWHFGPVAALDFNSDGTLLASSSFDATIKLWDVEAAKNLSANRLITTLKGHEEPVVSVSFSPDGRTIASGSWDGTVKLWDVSTGNEKVTIGDYENFVWSVTFSPSGAMLASASRDTKVRVWTLE